MFTRRMRNTWLRFMIINKYFYYYDYIMMMMMMIAIIIIIIIIIVVTCGTLLILTGLVSYVRGLISGQCDDVSSSRVVSVAL